MRMWHRTRPELSEQENEGRLVFALAAAHPSVDPASLQTITSWPRLLRIAAQENALVALREYCRNAPPPGITPIWARQLAILSLETERRMQLLQRRIETTIAGVNDTGVQPLLLKGAALATTVYGRWSDRPMRDIDLFVDPSRAEAARNRALRSGWMSDAELPGDAAYSKHHHLPPLVDAAGSGLRLEIHRYLLPVGHPFAVTPDEIVREGKSISIGQSRAIVMRPHHHAVHLAIHFVWSHQMRSGAWHACRDLGALVRANALDWNEVVDTAIRWKAASCMYWALRIAGALSGLDVPPKVLARLRPRLPAAILRRLERHFTTPMLRGETVCPSVGLDRALWSLAIMPWLQGHNDVRPWTVTSELGIEIQAHRGAAPQQRSSAHLRRCVNYLAGLA
jgi:hypothetical protein